MRNKFKKISEFVLIFLLFSLLLGFYFWGSIRSHNFLLPINTFKEFDLAFKVENFKANNVLNTDISMQFLPYRAVSSMGLTFWNPYSLGGLPFFEDIQARSLEVSNLLANLFKINLDYFLFFSAFLLLLFAAVSMYYFVRELNLRRGAAIFSSIAFVFSTPVIIWISYTLGVVFIWLPFLFLCVEKIYNKHKIFLPLFSLAICWQLFAGHPQAAFINILFVSCYIIYKFLKFNKDGYKKTIIIFSFLLLGVLLSAIQTLPSFQFIHQSEVYKIGRSLNSGNLFDITKDQFGNFSENLIILKDRLIHRGTLLVAPRYFGDVVNRDYHYPEQPLFNNFFETSSYAGLLTIIFAIFALYLIKKRKLYFWVFSCLIALALCFNLPFFNLVSLLPILNKISLGRLVFCLLFSLSILAAYGVNEVLALIDDKKFNKKIVILINVFIILILFLDLYKSLVYLQDQREISINNFRNSSIVEYLQGAGNNRYIGIGEEGLNIKTPLMPNQSMIYGTYDLRGYFVMLPERFFDISKPYLSRKRNFYFTDDIYNRNFLNIYNVKYIICPNDTCLKYENTYPIVKTENTVKILENDQAWPKAFITYNYKNYRDFNDVFEALSDPNFSINQPVLVENYKDNYSDDKIDLVNIEEYNPDRLVISATAKREGILVLTDNYYEGWKAYVNNKEVQILPVLGSLRGVPVEAGYNKIIFIYKPKLFNISLIISIVSLFIIFLLYILKIKKES